MSLSLSIVRPTTLAWMGTAMAEEEEMREAMGMGDMGVAMDMGDMGEAMDMEEDTVVAMDITEAMDITDTDMDITTVKLAKAQVWEVAVRLREDATRTFVGESGDQGKQRKTPARNPGYQHLTGRHSGYDND